MSWTAWLLLAILVSLVTLIVLVLQYLFHAFGREIGGGPGSGESKKAEPKKANSKNHARESDGPASVQASRVIVWAVPCLVLASLATFGFVSSKLHSSRQQVSSSPHEMDSRFLKGLTPAIEKVQCAIERLVSEREGPRDEYQGAPEEILAFGVAEAKAYMLENLERQLKDGAQETNFRVERMRSEVWMDGNSYVRHDEFIIRQAHAADSQETFSFIVPTVPTMRPQGEQGVEIGGVALVDDNLPIDLRNLPRRRVGTDPELVAYEVPVANSCFERKKDAAVRIQWHVRQPTTFTIHSDTITPYIYGVGRFESTIHFRVRPRRVWPATLDMSKLAVSFAAAEPSRIPPDNTAGWIVTTGRGEWQDEHGILPAVEQYSLSIHADQPDADQLPILAFWQATGTNCPK